MTKNEFQEAIREVNAKREIAGNVMMDKFTTIQVKYNNTLTELLSSMKGDFIVQNKVIQGLKED